MSFFKVSRISRHVETSFLKCRDWESRSRPRRDKSRPPGLRTMPGGLDLSQLCFDRDSWSRQRQKVSLDSRENLNSFRKLAFTYKKSRSRKMIKSTNSQSRLRNPLRPEMFFLNLDSLTQSGVSWFYHFSWSRFLNLSIFFEPEVPKKSW